MKNLTKKSRWMLYMSLFISGLAIFFAVTYIIAARDNVNDQLESIILIIVIIIAVLAVLSMLFSRMKLKRETKNLSSAYFEVYEEISDKLHGTAISSLEKKEIMADILDLFLLADKDSRTVSDVVGNDIDEFVTQIQSSFGYRSKLLFNVLTGVQYSIMYLFMMQGVEYLKNSANGFFNQNVSISMALYLIPLAFFGVPLITHFIRKNKIALVIIIPIGILVTFIAFMETMHKFFLDVPWVYTLVEGDMNVIPNVGMLLLWSGVLALTFVLKWVQRQVSINQL